MPHHLKHMVPTVYPRDPEMLTQATLSSPVNVREFSCADVVMTDITRELLSFQLSL